ncbi:MAG: glycosyltransferase, partial [Clostridium sp.]|nr:glycosyltransferase [Clostridium sp.]
MAKKPLLSIALLCSNRIDTVRRCLDSIVPIMEQIPSELILLDTSTDPAVPPVLAEYTDNITKFKWINDFSAARNVTVQKAKGEWYLYIDDDEWFVEIDDLIRFFKSGEYKQYGCANYIQRNFHDQDLTHYSDSWVSRIIKLTPETHFESKIHEYMVPVPGECKNLNLIANHTGYIAVTPEDTKRRFDRNSVLLKEMIEEEPDRLRWRVQLAQEYNAMHMWDEDIAFCEECLEYFKDVDNKWDNRDIGTFYAGLIEAYVFKKEYKKVYEVGERAIHDKRCSELCQAYVYLRIATAAFCEENWNLAKKAIESYDFLLKELDKTPEKKANQEGALLVNEANDAIPMRRAYAILIGAGLKEGSTAALHTYLPKLDWDKKVIYVFEPVIPVLIEAMVKLPYEPIFAEVMQLMWNNKELQKQVLTEVYEWEQKDARAKEILFRILDQIEPRHWYVWNAKVVIADMDGDKERLVQAIRGLFCAIKNVFLVPGEITRIIKKYKISEESLYLSVPFE